MQNRIIPIDLLQEFCDVIEFFAVDPVNRLYPDIEYKRFFFGEFLNGIIQKVVIIKDLDQEHQHVIKKLLMILIEFFGQEIERDNIDMADAMRWLFNQCSALHMHMFQSEINLYNLNDSQMIDKLPLEEVSWRKSLKEGDMIDAVKVDLEYNLKMWSKAQIVLITGDIFHLMFEDDLKTLSQKQLHWYSQDIAPYNSKTKDDEWRKELQEGDFIDAFDSTRVWYQSIIQGKEIVNLDGREVIKYRVGFRMFHPEGNKTDDNSGQTFFGWSDKFDEKISAFSPRIQKYKTFAKVISESQKDHQSARYDEAVEDQMDQLIYENQNDPIKVYAVPRRKFKSSLLVQFLNRFGEIGGFQKILDKINQDDNESTSIDLVFYYVDALAASSSMYNRVFIENYQPKLELAIRKKILNLSEQALRQAKKEKIDAIVQSVIGNLKSRLGLSYQEREHETCLFNLEIASLFLRQNFLEKRIDGAKIIQEVSKTANLSSFTTATETFVDPVSRKQRLSFANEVIEKLKQGRVLFQIFSQERGHSELVQRSDELLKLFITQNSLSQKELEYVWASTKLDETTKLELFKHFHELSSRLREQEVVFIINQLSLVPFNKVAMQELELAHELLKRSRSSDSSYGPLGVDYFWKVGFSNQENIDKTIVNYVINAISDIIKNWENEKKHRYVERILENLKNNFEGILSIKMLKKILINFSQPIEMVSINSDSIQNQQQPLSSDIENFIQNDQINFENHSSIKNTNQAIPEQFKSKNNYICHLEWQYGLLQSFFDNFIHYTFKARSSYRKKLEKDPNFGMKSVFDSVLCDKFIHSEQISERLEFLKFIMSNSLVDVQTEQLSMLWDELILHSLTIQDADMFYKWLKEICDTTSQKDNKEDIRSLVDFFKYKLSFESEAFSGISQDGFNCLQSFIIFVNQYSDKIIRLNNSDIYQVQKFTSYSNVTGKEFKSYTFNQNAKTSYSEDEEIEFQTNTDPSNIEGIQAIWKIAIEANEIRVFEKAMQLLVKLYQQVSFKLAGQLPRFDDEFLSKCIQQINQLKVDIDSRTIKTPIKQEETALSYTGSKQRILPPEERKLLRYLQLIKEYIKQSERSGTLGVKSHSSLLRGELLNLIQISSSLGYGKESRKFEIEAQSNMTLWDFRTLVAKLNPEYSIRHYKSENGEYLPVQMIIPDSIVLYRYTGVTILQDSDNGRTLGELRFKPNEQMNAYENKSFNSQYYPLLNSNNTELSEITKLVFTEIFKRFSVVDEENPDNRIMTRQTCAQFILSCTEEEIVTEEDQRVIDVFTNYDQDQDDKLQLDEFLKFYFVCCLNKESVVRENLNTLRFRNNLNQYREDKKRGVIINQLRENPEDMPRYKLSSNSIYFDSLFSLLDQQNEISQSAWTLIKQMTTKPELYNRIKMLNENLDFSWDQIIDASSIYKILYTLQIIESMLEDVPDTQKTNFELIQDKSIWIEKFLTVGGFQEILKLFEVSMSLISKKNVDNLTKFEKNFLEYMLKLIRIFIISAFAANDQSVYQLINLVKKSSSIQEEVKLNEESKENVKDEENQSKPDLFSTPQKLTVQQPTQIDLEKLQVTEQLLFGENFVGVTANNVGVEVKDGKLTQNSNQNQASTANRLIEDENDRFKELAQIMKETRLGEIIINKINFKDLHNELLEIISLILSKKEIIQEDALIMENNLSLWGAILIKNNDQIEQFYNFERASEKSGMFGVQNAEQMIITGLYTYKNSRVREEFSNTLAFLAQKVQTNKGRLLLFYLLDLMERNFPREDQYYLTRESKCFFDLFNSLIDEYYNFKKQSDVYYSIDNNEKYELMNRYNMSNLLRIVIVKLKKHQCKETKNSLSEDKTLIGYFSLIEKLVGYLQYDGKDILQNVFNETGLIHELFYEQLFFDPKTLIKLDNKCKTRESRTACYQLIQKVIEALEPKQLAEFLENDLWAILKDLKKPKTWKYVPADNSKQSTSFCGITNLGNICYMIAMLQQFFMVPQFRYQLLRAEDNSKPQIQKFKGMEIDDNMLRQLQRLFGYLEMSEKQEFNPTEFCFSFKDYEGNPTNTAIQSDTQEFLNIFFDRLENILKPTSQRHLLEGVFGGNNCSQLICQSCGKVRNIKESIYNLTVPVKDRKGLNDSLEKMIEGSIINDYKCGACNKNVDVFKRTLIGETPNVLIVHLQRLVFNFDSFQNDKINTRFEFPNTLDLKEYSFKHVMDQEGKQPQVEEGEQQDDYTQRLMQMEDSEFIYKLVGVIIHRGTGQHGHYWSLINTKRGSDELDENKPEWIQTERDTWREFNDETVKYFSFSDIRQEAFGGASDNSGGMGTDLMDDEMSSYLFNIGGGANSYGKNAYMLVYERKTKKDLIVLQQKTTTIISEENDQSLERADTANSRVDKEDQEIILEEVKLPYRKIDPFVPDWIRAEVSQDNVIFLMDRYIYNESFFNLLKAIFKHIANKTLMCQHHYGLEYIPHFTNLKRTIMKLAHKSIFELLAYYYYNHQLNDILSSVQSIIQFCDSSYSLTHGSESILSEFLEISYFSDSLNHFLKVAIECTDKSSRYYVCKLTAAIINKVYQIWNDAQEKDHEPLQHIKAQADSLIVLFVATLGDTMSFQNWSKLEQFMKMMYDIAAAGHTQARRFLSSTDAIPHLIEFILGNRSPSIKSGKQRKPLSGEDPYFEPIVQLVCLLTRYSLTKEMVQYEETWDLSLNPAPSTLLGYDSNLQDRYHRFELSEQANFYILNSIFIDFIQYMGYDTFSVGQFLAHLSYKSLQTTRLICDMQLRGISKNDYDRVKHYLDAVTQIVQVRDNFQSMKLEWIFGIAQPISYDVIMSENDQQSDEPKTRLGVKVLFSNNDEVYNYKSFLCNNNHDSMVDSLLHLLWRYKGKQDSYTVSCLVSFLTIVCSDDSISEYFSKMPGPTYQYARYTDWIKPYLNEQLIDARKGYAGTFSQAKEESAIKALSLYEKYEKYLEKIDRQSHSESDSHQETQQKEMVVKEDQQFDVEENVRNLIDQVVDNSSTKVTTQTNHIKDESITRKVIPCTPTPYIIVDIIQENNINNVDKNGVNLQQVSLDCTLSKSEPTGYYNKSMPKNLFKSFREYGRSKKAKSREEELQAKCIDNYFQSSGFNKNGGEVKIHSETSQNYVFADRKVIQDDDKQWNKVNDRNMQDIDEQDTGYTQDNEDVNCNQVDNIQDADYDARKHNSGIDEGLDEEDINVNLQENNTYDKNYVENLVDIDNSYALNQQNVIFKDQEPDSYNIKVIEPENEEQVQGNQGANRYDDNNNYNIYDEENNDQTQQDDEIVWPNGVLINQGLVIKYVATNNNHYPVMVCLEFIDPYQDEYFNQMLSKNSLNERYSYPKGMLEYHLNPTQTKTLLFVQKIDPWTDLQTYEKYVRLTVVQQDGGNISDYRSNNSGGNQSARVEEPKVTSQQLQVIDETEDQGLDPGMNVSDQNIKNVIDGIPQDGNDNFNASDTGGDAEAVDSQVVMVDGMRQCLACTYLNDPANFMCEICETRF